MRYGKKLGHDEVITASTSVHVLLNPLVEELKCAISTTGDGLKTFPGIEAYANLQFVYEALNPFISLNLIHRVKASLLAIAVKLGSILEGMKALHDEIIALVADLTRLRKILGHRGWSSKQVRAETGKWIKMLKSRLSRRDLVNDPRDLKQKDCGMSSPPEMIWQEWIRLHYTHEMGIYIPYDHEEIGFTNNPKELIFGEGRHHYRKLFGRGNVTKDFIVHGKFYCRVKQLNLTEELVKRILQGANRQDVQEGLDELRKFNRQARRTWKIRINDTGNMRELENRLQLFLKGVDFVE